MNINGLDNALRSADFPATHKQFKIPSKGGWSWGWGTAVPSGVAGWVPGAIFLYTTTGTLYVNSGTATSCTFTTAITSAGLASLALTTTGNGASLVGIEDSASYITGTTVETALAELARIAPKRNLGALAASAVINAGAGGSYYMTIGSSGAETNTLAVPTVQGSILSLCAATVGTGTRVVTVASAINKAGNNTITFAAAGDRITLIANAVGASTLAWRVLANDGPTLSTV